DDPEVFPVDVEGLDAAIGRPTGVRVAAAAAAGGDPGHRVALLVPAGEIGHRVGVGGRQLGRRQEQHLGPVVGHADEPGAVVDPVFAPRDVVVVVARAV